MAGITTPISSLGENSFRRVPRKRNPITAPEWEEDEVEFLHGRKRNPLQIDGDLFDMRSTRDTDTDGTEDILTEISTSEHGMTSSFITPRSSGERDSGRRSYDSMPRRSTSRYTSEQLERASFKRVTGPRNTGQRTRFTSQTDERTSLAETRAAAGDLTDIGEHVVAGAAALLKFVHSQGGLGGLRRGGDIDGILTELAPESMSLREPHMSKLGHLRQPAQVYTSNVSRGMMAAAPWMQTLHSTEVDASEPYDDSSEWSTDIGSTHESGLSLNQFPASRTNTEGSFTSEILSGGYSGNATRAQTFEGLPAFNESLVEFQAEELAELSPKAPAAPKSDRPVGAAAPVVSRLRKTVAAEN